MMAFVLIECLVSVLIFISVVRCESTCPGRCRCDPAASKYKVRCGTANDPIQFIDDIHFGSLATDIILLNFSSNSIVNVTKLVSLPSLRKLDLSRNNISFIESGVFHNSPDLKQIDLSYNLLSTLKQGTIDNLPVLKHIDISNNHLYCDCDVLWIFEQLQNKSVKLTSNPTCTFKKTLKMLYLRKIKAGMHKQCNLLTEVVEETSMKVRPIEDQIVFEGDSLRLNCLASGVSSALLESKHSDLIKANIQWSLLNQQVKENSTELNIASKYSTYGGVIDSSLFIQHLNRNHTGNWKCQLISHNFNETKHIMVIVISNATKYCPSVTITNNKGVYSWPKTIIGFTLETSCQGTSDLTLRAYHKCTKAGIWKNLNTSNCPYISETTRILEQFSKVNLTLTKVNVYDSAMHLKRNYTSDVKLLRDQMDIVYIARTVQNYLQFLTKEKELGHILSDIINNILNLPKQLLKEADKEDYSSRTFVQSVEEMTEYLTISCPLYATQEFKVKRDNFIGLTCTWYTDTVAKRNPKLHCATTNDLWQPIDSERTLEARIQIPAAMFHQMKHQQDTRISSERLFMAFYKNSNFFTASFQNETDSYTSVVGAKLVNPTFENISSPVYVVIRIAESQESSNPVPVWWDPALNKGYGAWTTKGCQVSHFLQDLLVFKCNQLGYYSVLQKMTNTNIAKIQYGAKFRVSHPAVYIGGFVLGSSLLTATVTYLLCYSSIQMAKKAKHSLVNSWIAVALLCFMYTFGIYQTEDLHICQSVGLIIHYLTLSSLLWTCVTISNMYKRLNKTDNIVLTDDGLQMDQPVQKPILGLYLVGWGVALIVCGISGAVNMRHYASHSYCFLESIPALSALFVPVSILLSFIVIFLLLIRCTIRCSDVVGHLSEGTQATENVDLDLLEVNVAPSRTASVKSASTRSSMIEDSEHGPMTQLRAHSISLLMYTFTWLCAAVSTSQPFRQYFLYEEDLFNILYALFASAFGMFNLFFYCVARTDVRIQWTLARRWFKRKQFCFRTRSVSDTNRPPAPLTANQAAETQMISRSSSRSSSQPKSNSRHSNNLKAAAQDLNAAEQANKSTNVDLVVLHRQQYRTNNTVPVYELAQMSSADIFYNPHQSGVARKFFRKQRRHMMKHNNLGPRHKRDIGSLNSIKTNRSNSDVSSNIFRTSPKVNNTNIHVEKIKECKQKNLNILSDNCSDSEFSNRLDIPVHQLMLGAKKMRSHPMRKPKINTCVEDIEETTEKDNMRTVSQQCSLEYSSETLSERVLDKDLDLDASVACSDFTDFKVDNGDIGQVYVNPMEDLLYSGGRRSLRSSLSTSDVDELYAQIHQTGAQCSRSKTLATICADFPTNDFVIHLNDDDNNDTSCNSDGLDKSETAV